MERHEIKLSFCVWGFKDISHDDLTKILDVAPSKIFIEGERMNPKFPRLAKENAWFLDSPAERFADFNEKMGALLDIIESKIDKFEAVCNKYLCEFSCALFIQPKSEESIPWIHFGPRYIEVIRKVKIEFDFDIYCLEE
ncbi:DUF4279 domain-containing protein [Parapedobacter sp. DT-150]|uniref:DUF4279 domain-containing protein n=1 Tax=Parapedobacter sp. DT-150 TaxID=3396162 RepID=UPI003F1989B8